LGTVLASPGRSLRRRDDAPLIGDAPPPAGASQRKVAMSAAVRKALSVRGPALVVRAGPTFILRFSRLRRRPRRTAHRRTRRNARAPAAAGGDAHAGGEASILRSRTCLADRSARLRSTPERPRGERRGQGRARSSMTCRATYRCEEALSVRAPALVVRASDDLHIALFAPSSPATTRRSSTKAPQRAGAPRWKVAMGTPA